jgi:hypothetical protein
LTAVAAKGLAALDLPDVNEEPLKEERLMPAWGVVNSSVCADVACAPEAFAATLVDTFAATFAISFAIDGAVTGIGAVIEAIAWGVESVVAAATEEVDSDEAGSDFAFLLVSVELALLSVELVLLVDSVV